MSGELEALAVRCEAASGPDREIDKEIYYEILGFCPHANTVRSGAQSDTGFDCVDCGADSWGNLGTMGQRLRDKAPAYTASIDSAMTLVPEGWHTHLASQDRHSLRWKWCLRGGFGWTGEARAATPALALCAAALRARAHSQESTPHAS